jgi:aryl-alcohol dehydrogenase-like predicted oxidoreductase
MVTPTRADGGPIVQLAWVDRDPELEESVDAMAESLHEDKVLRIDGNNFEGSRVEDSRAYVDRKGECGRVDIRTR